MNKIKLTYFSNISEEYLNGFKKNIDGKVKSFNNYGISAESINFTKVDIINFFSFLLSIFKCKSKIILIRSVGLRSIFIFFLAIFLKLKKKKIILDVPTPFSTVIHEYRINKNKRIVDFFYLIALLLFGPFLLYMFDYIIEYDDEKLPFNFFCKNKIILSSNGYDVNSINCKKKLSKVINFKFKILIVGFIAPWHGLERIIYSLEKYYKNNHHKYIIYLNVVGYIDTNYLLSLNKIIKKLNLSEFVIFHGIKYDRDLEYIYNSSHIGFGSMGLKIIGSCNRSELKIREYCSAGLPFVLEANDNDFNDNQFFLYKLDCNNKLIDFEKIVNWYNHLPDGLPVKMREFAIQKLDYKIKVKKLINQINFF